MQAQHLFGFKHRTPMPITTHANTRLGKAEVSAITKGMTYTKRTFRYSSNKGARYCSDERWVLSLTRCPFSLLDLPMRFTNPRTHKE